MSVFITIFAIKNVINTEIFKESINNYGIHAKRKYRQSYYTVSLCLWLFRRMQEVE